MMARRYAAGAARRDALLDAAEQLLTTVGYAQTSMRAVAAAADVRIGHLQHYFPNRAELIRAVLERVLTRSHAELAEVTDPETAVTYLLSEHDNSSSVRLFVEIWAIAAAEPAIRDVVTAFYAEYTHQVAEFIRNHRPDSDAATTRARAETFVTLMEGAALMRSGIAAHRSVSTDAILRKTAIALLTGA
ncbi:TetR/AcrR family transcriptional regulator [Nocardia sp. GCM10030253]|uniref:TetR/AcrR family transcriptional regulator n=1 Tax=Nocardia sp. GCM10030253 TaxID=3273404 RepID=UPI003644DD3A